MAKTGTQLANEMLDEPLEWEKPSQEDIDKLLAAGFTLDDTYSGGSIYFYDDKDGPWSRNTINLSYPKGKKRYYSVIRGQSFAYPDLDTAIDRAKYISGKSPFNGSLKWNGRDFE